MKQLSFLIPAVILAVEAGAAAPRPHMNESSSQTNHSALATFGGGCFWCMEAVYQGLPGVISVTSGYAGGHKDKPTYKEVCSGLTGHAEVVQICYDPAKISYDDLLEVFWEAHDPTTINRQGNDVGAQYRSVIFCQDEAQRVAAVKSKAQAAAHFSRPIVTQIEPLTAFFPAEGYHQDYYRNNANAPYCQAVIRPKLEKLEEKLREKFKQP